MSTGVVKPIARPAVKKEEEQLDILAKELGLEIGLEASSESSDVPAPPPPPSIESIKSDKVPTKTLELPLEKPAPVANPSPEPIKSEELLGMETIEKDELDKDKDDLLKALRELDEL